MGNYKIDIISLESLDMTSFGATTAMRDNVINVRLSNEQLAKVDEVKETGFESRAETIRELINLGLDREVLLRKIEESDKKINKLMAVSEAIFSYAFMSLKLKTLDGSVSQDQFNDAKTESKEVLAALIHKQFGE